MPHDFYMCITLLSTEEAIKMKMTGGKTRPVLNAVAKGMAKTVASPEALAPKMAASMAGEIPTKMSRKGITAGASVAMVQGPFYVIKVSISRGPSLDSMVEKIGAKSEGAAKFGSCFVKCLPQAAKDKLEEDVIGKMIAKKVMENMAPEMETQVAEKGIAMAADGVIAAELGPYLLEALKKPV